MAFSVQGQYVDIRNRKIYPAELIIDNGVVQSILEIDQAPDVFITPGFIDSHVHIESSMLIPSSFARMAVVHGTIGTVSDPHEIANVCGVKGIEYMIENGKKVPFHFFFGAPSCVPATTFETAGASVSVDQVTNLLASDDIYYLSEMMNFPGVLHKDPEVMQKIRAAHKIGKPIDGHAPGLRGKDAQHYIEAGISTDHECFTIEEALDKLSFGMKILIREGSAAKNFEALHELIEDHPRDVMLCSDDKHPDSLLEGHINQLCARAVAKGADVFNVLRCACVNPVLHYQLPTGLLQIGDPADFIVLENLSDFKVLATYINGALVAEAGASKIPHVEEMILNNFNAAPIQADQIKVLFDDFPKKNGMIPVIEAIEGQLITNCKWITPIIKDGCIQTDTKNDVLKLVVYNRYHSATPKVAFIHNFGFTQGAIASTVAHDSHNIIAVGVDDPSITKAINEVIQTKGGISCVNTQQSKILGLPVAGLMTNEDPYQVTKNYIEIDQMAKALGGHLHSPFMTLSFMALLVIPHLKLSDLGLFDGDEFKFL